MRPRIALGGKPVQKQLGVAGGLNTVPTVESITVHGYSSWNIAHQGIFQAAPEVIHIVGQQEVDVFHITRCLMCVHEQMVQDVKSLFLVVSSLSQASMPSKSFSLDKCIMDLELRTLRSVSSGSLRHRYSVLR
jgi:hypothetical protein